MKRVLITGAKGFLGKPCIAALQEKNLEVHAISSQPIPESTSNVLWYQVNLHDHAAVKGLLETIRPSYLLHLAWYVKHGSFWSSDENLRWVTSSLSLVDEFIKNGGQRFVGMGTCAEYDWSEKSCCENLSEELTLIRPATLYGASKAGLCMVLKALCALKGIDFAWGRLFFPYGPYEEPERLIPYTVRSLLKGENTVCKFPDLQRDFIFVEDIAKIMASLVDSKVNGEINVASGQAVKLGSVVASVAKLLNAQDLVQYGSSSAKSTDPPLLAGDIKRLRNELGFTKITSIEEGLEKTVNWWRKHYQYTS